MSDLIRVGFVGDVHFVETPPVSRKDNYLQSLLMKMAHICSECDVIIILGDLFDRPAMSLQSFSQVAIFFATQIREGKKFYSIIGNHDVANFNLSRLDRTSLGILHSIRFITILDQTGIDIGPLTIDVIPFSYQVKITTKPRGPASILLGHCFYDSSLEPEYSISPEDVRDSGYSYIMLGHDHSPYPPIQLGNTCLLRFGSLCRNTSLRHHTERMPQYLRFEINTKTNEVSAPVMRLAGGLAPQDVFRPEVFDNPTGSEMAHLASIEGLLNRFENTSATSDRCNTVGAALIELEAPPSVIKTIKFHYEDQGMLFR